MRVFCVFFASLFILNLASYSYCTVLASTGYLFSNPAIRRFLVNSGLSTIVTRKANALYELSNFRYASDRGTDVKKAEMDSFELVELDPKKKTTRSGLEFEDQNYTKEEERLYSEKLFGVLTDMDKNGCISRLLCEIGANPKSFGVIGMKINHYLQSVPPVTWNSSTFPYLEAFKGGLGSDKSSCGLHYRSCTYDLKQMMKFLWPFLKPISVKFATGGAYFDTGYEKFADSNSLSEGMAVKVDNSETEMQMHHEEIIENLKKKTVDNDHMKDLMEKTSTFRRKKVMSSNLKISEVQEIFPALKLQEWIAFDFSYESKTNIEEREERFKEWVLSLKKMKNDAGEDDLINVLKWAEKRLSPTKKSESRITILKVGDPVLTYCSNLHSPHLLVYMGNGGEVATALILGQGGIICRLTNLTPFDIFDSLLGVYYTFDYQYPKAYFNFLLLLQTMLLKNARRMRRCHLLF